MGYDTGIADRLRAAGLKVVEIAGWQIRGSATFKPFGSLDHHTAGSARGNAPSLTICIYGRADLPGPLCQVLIGRDNTCYVIAAGRANHAGRGQWGAANGNEDLYGIERENVGDPAEPWREDQTDTAARAHAALIRGRADAAAVARHAEYALPPGRKPDTHSVSGLDLRRRVSGYLAGGPGPEPPPAPPTPEDLMPYPTIGVQADPNNPQQAHLHRPWAVLKPGQVVWLTDWPLADIPPVHSEAALTSRQAQCDGATWRGLVAAGVVDTIEIITKDAEGRPVDVTGSTQMFDQAVAATRSTYASALPVLG